MNGINLNETERDAAACAAGNMAYTQCNILRQAVAERSTPNGMLIGQIARTLRAYALDDKLNGRFSMASTLAEILSPFVNAYLCEECDA